MKTNRLRSILLCLLLAALLCACAQERSAPESGAEPEPSAAVTVVDKLELPADFGRAESLAMANYLCRNRALLAGEYLYTLEFDEALQPVLGRYRIVDGTPREFTVLVGDCVAEYLTEDGEALYYLDRGRVTRLPLAGGEPTVLCEGAQSLQLADGRLYFLDGEGRLCRMDRRGGGRTVLREERCGYPYVLGDLLLAQKGSDGALYLMELEGESEWRLSEGKAYAPLLADGTLYFTQETADGKRLCRLAPGDETPLPLSGETLRGAAEFFYAGGWQARLALAGDSPRQSFLPLDGKGAAQPCPYSGYHLLDYVGPNLRVDAMYEADGRLGFFVLCTPDGGELRYFGGRVIE